MTDLWHVQQLSPSIRRIRAVPAGGDPTRLPDPAMSDWALQQLASVERREVGSLAEAVEGFQLPDGGTIALEHLGHDADGAPSLEIGLAEGERLYGAYDSDQQALQRRGDHVHLVNELHPLGRHNRAGACEPCGLTQADLDAGPLEIGAHSNYGELLLPVAYSSRGWGVYVSSARDSAVLDLGQRAPDRLTWRADAGEADIYLLGPAPLARLVSVYTRLTGRQPHPPAWTLGFIQSRFGYESFEHARSVLERLEAERLPVHGIVFDVQWLEDHVNLRWDPTHFPEPEKNLAAIAEQGVRTVVITEPGTRAKASNHESGVAVDAFATDAEGQEFDSKQWYAQRGIEGYREIEPGPGALVNFFREPAADWWYEQHLPLVQQGVDAWWLDLNEPEDVTPDVKFRDVDWPAQRRELAGEDVRNLLAIAQQRAFARRDRAHTDRRPFLLTRSGSAGSQRYGSSPWSGDVGATWEDLRVQPRLALTAGMCGLPLWGCDIGGFHGSPDPELFVRWYQMGAVLPIMRAHGCMDDREPWAKGDEALEAIRPSLVLRGQLLPSLVTWQWEAARAGQPLVRPMLLGPHGLDPASDEAAAWAADERWADVEDQWFLGPMLVAPVLEAGASTRSIELPRGEWVDPFTGDVHEGGGRIELPVSLETLPILLPRHAALVVDPDPLAGRGHAWPPPALEAWSWAGEGETSSATVLLDDGETRLHEQGAYCHQRIEVRDGEVRVERLGGSWPASRIGAATPAPGRLGAGAAGGR